MQERLLEHLRRQVLGHLWIASEHAQKAQDRRIAPLVEQRKARLLVAGGGRAAFILSPKPGPGGRDRPVSHRLAIPSETLIRRAAHPSPASGSPRARREVLPVPPPAPAR